MTKRTLESTLAPDAFGRQASLSQTQVIQENTQFAITNSTATPGDDVILGTQGKDEIFALTGNDTVIGLGGDDRIFGGLGVDDIVAGGGNDFIDGGTGDDLIFGGSGLNQDFDSGNDTLNGGSGDDTIFGQDGNDTLNGNEGNDNIDGGFGAKDIISGGAGNDIIFSQSEQATIKGGNGDDIINSGFGNDVLQGGAGNDRLFSGFGNDQLLGEAGNDQLNADEGDDIVSGGSGNDIVFGGSGNDSLTGDDGNDQLLGGDGNDFLSGGNGNDRLIGVDSLNPQFGFGKGERDTLTGSAGSDTFVFGTGTEVFYDDLGNKDYALINDFDLSQDSIQLLANPKSSPDVFEQGAGQSLAEAEVIPSGSASLETIDGKITNGKDVDLFQITLTGGAFSASTVGGAEFDTQLFLFDENGTGVLANDQASSSAQSTLSASLDPGTYFLAVSSYNVDPVSKGGLIFPDGLPADAEVVGPTGPGGGAPLSNFKGGSVLGSSGDYSISLSGVSAAPPKNAGTFTVGASPTGLPLGTGIFFETDLIGVVAGIAPSQLSLGSNNFVLV